MANKKLGKVLGIPLFEDEDGDHYLEVSSLEKLWLTNQYMPEYTIENFVEEYTALTSDPQARLLSALADFIGDDDRDHGTTAYRELMAAFDAVSDDLEEGDDDEE